MKIIFRFFATVLLLFMFRVTIFAQTVSNVTATQVGKTIEVAYDLDKAADITLHFSTNGGMTYRQLYQVTGDVGKTIGPGHNSIVWDVMAELGELMGDDIVFKVKVEANAEAAWRKKQKKEEAEAKAREIALAKEAKAKEKEAEKTKKALEKEAKANEIISAQEAKAKEMALAKEAKEKGKALEKEARLKEQAIKKEERRLRMQNMPYSTFFTINGAYSPLPQWSYGFKVGGMKNVGWYVNVMTNFNFAGWGNPFTDMDNRYYYLTGESKTIRFSAQAGLVVRTCKPLSLLFGVGYGYRTLTFKTDYSWTNGSYQHNSGWFSYPERTYNGVDASFGLLFDIKGFVFSAEAVTTNFRTIEARVGVGYCFPHNQSKKQTVKVVK